MWLCHEGRHTGDCSEERSPRMQCRFISAHGSFWSQHWVLLTPFIFTFMHLADAFIQSDLQSILAIHLFYQYVCSLGIEPTTCCAADAMLYHWATGTHIMWLHCDLWDIDWYSKQGWWAVHAGVLRVLVAAQGNKSVKRFCMKKYPWFPQKNCKKN